MRSKFKKLLCICLSLIFSFGVFNVPSSVIKADSPGSKVVEKTSKNSSEITIKGVADGVKLAFKGAARLGIEGTAAILGCVVGLYLVEVLSTGISIGAPYVIDGFADKDYNKDGFRKIMERCIGIGGFIGVGLGYKFGKWICLKLALE